MPNPVFGEAGLDLPDGRSLTLRYDFNALAEAEDALPRGRTLADVHADAALGRQRLKDGRALLYGCLRHHHPEITVEAAGDLFLESEGRATTALTAAAEAAHRGLRTNPPKGAAKPRPPRGTGTRSSRHGAKQG